MPKISPLPMEPDNSSGGSQSRRTLALRAVAVNGFWLMLPVLAINIAFSGALPPAYQAEVFWADIPPALAWAENGSRMAVTALPLLMAVRWNERAARSGLALYGVGIAAYAAAWAALILAPEGSWSTSLIGFAAPAWLPALWLGGLFMAARPYWRWVGVAFPVVALVFVVTHIAHTALVFGRLS